MLYGKDFTLTGEGYLEFAPEVHRPEPDIRRWDDARPYYWQDPEGVPGNKPLYYMYRGVYREEDWEIFLGRDIRYDITVLLPGTIGSEYIKTIGHFHPLKPDGSATYPEYYEVLAGEALYLLQRNSRSGDVEEIIAVEAKKGDKVFIAPGYGHVTINPGDTPLVMANLIERNFSSLYGPFRDKKGAAYYYVQGGNGRGEFVKNEHYHNSVGLQMVPAPSLCQPVEGVKGKTLYEAFLADPASFELLR